MLPVSVPLRRSGNPSEDRPTIVVKHPGREGAVATTTTIVSDGAYITLLCWSKRRSSRWVSCSVGDKSAHFRNDLSPEHARALYVRVRPSVRRFGLSCQSRSPR